MAQLNQLAIVHGWVAVPRNTTLAGIGPPSLVDYLSSNTIWEAKRSPIPQTNHLCSLDHILGSFYRYV